MNLAVKVTRLIDGSWLSIEVAVGRVPEVVGGCAGLFSTRGRRESMGMMLFLMKSIGGSQDRWVDEALSAESTGYS